MFEGLFGKSFNPDKDIPDLSGKVILVTGGNTGLGKETTKQLAKHSPKEIFLAARTQSKAEAAIAEIKEEVPNSNISFLQLDLSSFTSIKKAADDFRSRSDRLDVLINNAGIMAVPFEKTEDGYEIQFGTDHMGPALLTKLLLPTLLTTADQPGSDVRVVNLSSQGHRLAPCSGIIYDQDELEKWFTWRRYGQAKLANILHARELQKRYPSLTATSLHPGVIMTNLFTPMRESSVLSGYWVSFMRAFTRDIASGAWNTLWAATAPKDVVRSSYYWQPVGIKSNGSFWAARKAVLAEELWHWQEQEFEKHGY